MKNKKKALVSGATGYIGSNLVKGLILEGYSVGILCRRTSSLGLLHSVKEKISIHIIDNQYKSIEKAVSSFKPDIVFHLASLFLSQHQPSDIKELMDSNILFGSFLIDALVENGVNKMVNTGTSWEHYNDQDYNPVNLYSATKKAYESILQYYIESFNVNVINLKLYDTYGPNDPRKKIINILIDQIGKREPLLMSPGEQLLDLTYIEDIVSGYIHAADLLFKKTFPGSEYVIRSGRLYSLRDLIELINKLSGLKSNVKLGGRPYRFREVMVPWQKGEILPGWKARYNLSEGLKKILSAPLRKI